MLIQAAIEHFQLQHLPIYLPAAFGCCFVNSDFQEVCLEITFVAFWAFFLLVTYKIIVF